MKLFFADPGQMDTFESCKLDWSEKQTNGETYQLHRDLIRLRREDPVFASQEADRIHGTVLADEAFALRYVGLHGDDRLLLVNLGRDLFWTTSAEPLAGPPTAPIGLSCSRQVIQDTADLAWPPSIRANGICQVTPLLSCGPNQKCS